MVVVNIVVLNILELIMKIVPNYPTASMAEAMDKEEIFFTGKDENNELNRTEGGFERLERLVYARRENFHR
jgi:hypothetical protein